MNQYPVIFLTFKNIDGLNFQRAYDQLVYEIGSLFEEHSYLTDCEQLSENERQMFRKLQNQQASEVEISRSLQLLLQIMNKYYGKQVILLLDEYDVPLAKAFTYGYYDQMVNLIRGVLGNALKTNEYLQFAVLSGCMRISKESIFTGINNFNIMSITDVEFDEYFGFTDEEVKKLLEDYELSNHYESIKNWYDGYHFGNVDVYCPWDVICHCRKLLADPAIEPQNYWMNTSSNDIVKKIIEKTDNLTTKREIERLVAGEVIIKELHQELTYEEMYTSIDNIWSVLFTTGYLTQRGRAEGSIFKS